MACLHTNPSMAALITSQRPQSTLPSFSPATAPRPRSPGANQEDRGRVGGELWARFYFNNVIGLDLRRSLDSSHSCSWNLYRKYSSAPNGSRDNLVGVNNFRPHLAHEAMTGTRAWYRRKTKERSLPALETLRAGDPHRWDSNCFATAWYCSPSGKSKHSRQSLHFKKRPAGDIKTPRRCAESSGELWDIYSLRLSRGVRPCHANCEAVRLSVRYRTVRIFRSAGVALSNQLASFSISCCIWKMICLNLARSITWVSG